MWSIYVHRKVWKEVPADLHRALREAMRTLAGSREPGRFPGARPIAGSRYPGSFRLRVGRLRVLALALPDEKTIAFTTAFVKKRPSDYREALARHDDRVRALEDS